MLVGEFEFNPKNMPIWVWFKLSLTPKRYNPGGQTQFQEPMPNSPLLLSNLYFGAWFL